MRLKKNYTQSYMADELGIDVTNYGRLERGDAQISIERLDKIAAILEIDTKYLLEDGTNDYFSHQNNELSCLLREILTEIRIIRMKIK